MRGKIRILNRAAKTVRGTTYDGEEQSNTKRSDLEMRTFIVKKRMNSAYRVSSALSLKTSRDHLHTTCHFFTNCDT